MFLVTSKRGSKFEQQYLTQEQLLEQFDKLLLIVDSMKIDSIDTSPELYEYDQQAVS
jgi:hypothetical protein